VGGVNDDYPDFVSNVCMCRMGIRTRKTAGPLLKATSGTASRHSAAASRRRATARKVCPLLCPCPNRSIQGPHDPPLPPTLPPNTTNHHNHVRICHSSAASTHRHNCSLSSGTAAIPAAASITTATTALTIHITLNVTATAAATLPFRLSVSGFPPRPIVPCGHFSLFDC